MRMKCRDRKYPVVKLVSRLQKKPSYTNKLSASSTKCDVIEKNEEYTKRNLPNRIRNNKMMLVVCGLLLAYAVHYIYYVVNSAYMHETSTVTVT